MPLTIKQYAKAKRIELDFLKKVRVEEKKWQGGAAVAIPYLNTAGKRMGVRIRSSMNKGGFRWKPKSKLCLYGLWLLPKMHKPYVCLVEGESDCHALWLHKVQALGLPGAASWKESWAQQLQGFDQIYVVREPDAGGEAVMKWLAKSSIRDRVRLITLPGVKDPSELYLADPNNFHKAWKAAMKAAVPWQEPEQEQSAAAGNQASYLLSLTGDAEVFHTPDGESFASVPVNGHRENWPIKHRNFRHWMLGRYYRETKSAPQNKAVQDALAVLESRAHFEGPEIPVFVRLAEMNGKIYLDLGDQDWNVVEIDTNGWRIGPVPSVRFRRARGMGALPKPVTGGRPQDIKRFVNVANDADALLIQAWLVSALRPRGPFPILTLHGEQGSAKSTTSRVLRALTDPNTAPSRSEPREERDLMIAASNGWIINLDNLSRIPAWLSDGLCRLATGGGFGTRELFTDREEALFEAQRPIIINGIEELAVRGDLLDRALILYLPSIPESKRQPETKFWRDFESARPKLLGAFLDVVADALRRQPTVRLSNTPRLADFAVWATAAESSLGWESGSFMTVYSRNQVSANDLALDASPVTEAIRSLVAEDDFQGTATELLKALSERADESMRRQRGWPQNGQALSNTLRRLSSNLRKSGLEVIFSRSGDRQRRRLVIVRRVASKASAASA